MSSKLFTFLTIASLALVSSAAHAQRGEQAVSAPTALPQLPFSSSAAELTRSMSSRLKLNEAQYIQLYQVNKTRVSQLALIEREYRNDAGARDAKVVELEAQYEQECSRVLTPSQLSQLRQDDKPAQPGNAPAGTGNGVG